ncbi:uncharacterized protein CXQ87_001673 [Candidozyma duobushaemuli]|uniref:Uncharacterized protein n=1 Tax=Candidozyma duobushaemuli TaxID=1231522 RepID=A0A2V1A4R5_9ASCO|nr:uncharacterized protein CXQ87_001673 [[Candida] duobushaemulonis]PVH13567.1 hypothetical protein CXQ87_001673 [[Candida] duobushaemulonis]
MDIENNIEQQDSPRHRKALAVAAVLSTFALFLEQDKQDAGRNHELSHFEATIFGWLHFIGAFAFSFSLGWKLGAGRLVTLGFVIMTAWCVVKKISENLDSKGLQILAYITNSFWICIPLGMMGVTVLHFKNLRREFLWIFGVITCFIIFSSGGVIAVIGKQNWLLYVMIPYCLVMIPVSYLFVPSPLPLETGVKFSDLLPQLAGSVGHVLACFIWLHNRTTPESLAKRALFLIACLIFEIFSLGLMVHGPHEELKEYQRHVEF